MAEVELFRGEPGGFGDAQYDPRRPDGYASTLHGIIAGGGFSPYFAATEVSWGTQAKSYKSGADWVDANGNPLILLVGGEVGDALCVRINADGTVSTERTFTSKQLVPELTNLSSALHSDGSTTPYFFVAFGSSGDIEYRTRGGTWATAAGTPAQAYGLLPENGNLWAILTNGYQVRKWPAGTNPVSGTAGAAIDVGDSNWKILGGAILARSYIVFVKPDGIYVYDIDTNRFENIAPWLKNNINTATGRGTKEWGGEVFVPLGWGGMLRVTQSLDVLDASPVPRWKRPDVETPGRYRISAMSGDASYLYALHEPYWQLLQDAIGLEVRTTADDVAYNDRTAVVTDQDAFTNFTLTDLNPGSATSFIYIGATSRFLMPILGISASAASATPTMQYWDGDSWESVTITDYTGQMTRIGGLIPSARIPDDWAQTAVDGSTLYWVRINLTTVQTATAVWEIAVLPDVVPVSGTNTEEDAFDRAGARTHIFRGYQAEGGMHWDDIGALPDDYSLMLFFSALQAQGAAGRRQLIAAGPLGHARLPVGLSAEPRMERYPDCVNGFTSIHRISATDRIGTNEPAPTTIKQIEHLLVYGRDATEADRIQAWAIWDDKDPVPIGFNFGLPCKLRIDPPSERGQGYQYAVWVGIEDAAREERPPMITRVVASVLAVPGDDNEVAV